MNERYRWYEEVPEKSHPRWEQCKSIKAKAENRFRKWKASRGGKVTSEQCSRPTWSLTSILHPHTHRVPGLTGTSWGLQLEPGAVSSERSENTFCMHASPCLTAAQKLLQMPNEGALGSQNMANLMLLQWRLISPPTPADGFYFRSVWSFLGMGVVLHSSQKYLKMFWE